MQIKIIKSYRMCCTSDFLNKPALKSKTNLVVISLYTRLYIQNIQLKYKYGKFFFKLILIIKFK